MTSSNFNTKKKNFWSFSRKGESRTRCSDDPADNGNSNSSNSNSGDDGSASWKANTSHIIASTSTILPNFARLTVRTLLGVTITLYILNQNKVLPRPLSAVVSKTLFWPTLPITLSRRVGKWITRVDDTVILGGAPFSFLDYPQKLYNDYGVRGVINMCEEYQGPLQEYSELGIEQLHLPTTDHFEPTVDDFISAISFIQRHQSRGNSVYVHCRAGHGRSAATVFAWLMYQDVNANLQTLNAKLREQRNVRKTLYKQPNILKFQSRLKERGAVLSGVIDDADEEGTKDKEL